MPCVDSSLFGPGPDNVWPPPSPQPVPGSQGEVLAQINGTHLGVVEQLRRGALGDDAALADDVARSQMSRVSRTLWSVIRTPRWRSRRWETIPLMSPTAMGSTPAKGSSRSITFGSTARARAISRRRRSPAGEAQGQGSATWAMPSSSSNVAASVAAVGSDRGGSPAPP